MPNTFVFDITPQLTNIITEIDANETKIDLIRGTDVPAIVAEIDANETKIDLIRATDVPAIQTNIDANETKIDAIAALIPQIVRGHVTEAYLLNDTAVWEDLLNITTSQGKLILITCYLGAGITDAQLKFTIDSQISNTVLLTDITTGLFITHSINPTGTGCLILGSSTTVPHFFNLEFDSSLRVQTRINTGAGDFECRMLYSLDNF